MAASLLLEGGESTYNEIVEVIQESSLTTATQQYWAQRRVQAESSITRFRTGISTSQADSNWRAFCSRGFSFLDSILQRSVERIEKPLREHWKGNKQLARDAKRLFRADAIVEILIPYSHSPIQFVKLSPRSSTFEFRNLSASDSSQSYLLGKPYLGVSWKGVSLFAITPDGFCVTMDTFYVDTPDGHKWSTDPVLQQVFTETVREFQGHLQQIEAHFAPFMTLLNQQINLRIEERSLSSFNGAEQVWKRLHLPDGQKLEVLRALEFFESSNPAAPHSLLLTGPPGVGKSLLGRAIAETTTCRFQHLTPASLKLDHLGGSGRRVREIWEEARRNQPSILYLDECEGVFGRRGAAETDAISTEIVQAFLAEWDGLSKSDRTWVIGATNRRDLLDDGILSRFGWEMQINLPAVEDRISILRQELTNVGVEISLPSEVGVLSQGMSGRDIQEVAKLARRTSHPGLPTVEQILAATIKLRKSGNTQVSLYSKWENLVLDQKLLDRLKLIAGLLRDAERWTAQGISIPRAVLLEGPRGTGKTETARTLANESGLAFFSATTADLKANYLGQSGNRVKQLFERARSHSPSIVFLDELDIIAPDRGYGEDDPLTREIVGQLLQEIDGVQHHPEHIFLLGATNRPGAIDTAILSRFEEKLLVPLPDREARIRLLSIFLRGKRLGFSREDGAILLADLADGKGMAGRDLRDWIKRGEQSALLRAMENGGPDQYVITLDDFSSPD